MRHPNLPCIFSNEEAITRRLGALMIEQSDEWAVCWRYMTLETLANVSEAGTKPSWQPDAEQQRSERDRLITPRAGTLPGRAPQAAILFDKFHILRHLGDALDKVRKSEYARLSGRDRSFIKGQKYTLLSHRENLTLEGRAALKKLLAANKRLNMAYLLKESFGQLWDYEREGNCSPCIR